MWQAEASSRFRELEVECEALRGRAEAEAAEAERLRTAVEEAGVFRKDVLGCMDQLHRAKWWVAAAMSDDH